VVFVAKPIRKFRLSVVNIIAVVILQIAKSTYTSKSLTIDIPLICVTAIFINKKTKPNVSASLCISVGRIKITAIFIPQNTQAIIATAKTVIFA